MGDNRVLLSKGYGGGAELIELSADAADGLTVATVWKSPRVLQTKFSNVVVHDGHAFALSEGILECVELESGRRRWKSGRYGHGQILGVGAAAAGDVERRRAARATAKSLVAAGRCWKPPPRVANGGTSLGLSRATSVTHPG